MDGTPNEEPRHFDEAITPERMTQTEAEEVIALWARLQEQRHTESGLPSVSELAEVLGAEPEHVQSLLMQVRSKKTATEIEPAQKSRNGRKVWIWSGVAAVAAAAVYGLMYWTSLMMHRASPYADVISVVPPMEAPMAPEVAIAIPSPNAIEGIDLPNGVSVSLDGTKVVGQTATRVSNPDQVTIGRDVMSAFHSLLGGIESTGNYAERYSADEIAKALSAKKSLKGAFRFVTAEVTVHGTTKAVAVPVSTGPDANVSALVKNEANSRFEELAQWAAKEGGTTEFKMVSN